MAINKGLFRSGNCDGCQCTVCYDCGGGNCEDCIRYPECNDDSSDDLYYDPFGSDSNRKYDLFAGCINFALDDD